MHVNVYQNIMQKLNIVIIFSLCSTRIDMVAKLTIIIPTSQHVLPL